MLSRLSVRFFFIRPDVRASMTSCHLLSTVQVVHRTSACEAVPILKMRAEFAHRADSDTRASEP